MTCIMDPVYQARPHQPMWGPVAAPVPTLDMEYFITHHPPFTSPPATPMTPVTPHPHIFNPPHYEQALPAPPPPPNPFPPSPQQNYPPLDFRLYALCQQLLSFSQVPDSHQKAFWDQFMMEFFTDTATLTVAGDFGEGHRKYSLTRQWIQWYFKTMLENGVIGICLRLPHFITSFTQSGHQLECNDAVMETDITMATRDIVKVCKMGSLLVEFSLEEKPRIISWFFLIRDYQEYVPRTSLTGIVEDKVLTMNITNHGLLPAVHALLARAGMVDMVDTSLQDQLPACSATPTTASLTSQWPDQVPVLNPQLTMAMTPLHVASNPPPPLHSLPPCSVALSTHDKPAKLPSPLSSSSRKMRPPQHSPASRSQYIMVAAEATTLLQAADDLVPGLDERTIIRVDNTRPSSSPSHCNGSSDTSAETTPTAQPTCPQDQAFLSATLSQVTSLGPPPLSSWGSPDLPLPASSIPGAALTSAK